jgi:type IV pilus assembly protein PilW
MSTRRTLLAPPARGYSIVELMVSITVGLILLAGLVTLFAGNSRERGEIERVNEQTENGRYALQMIGDDLRGAGYLATLNPGTVAGPNPQLAAFIPGAPPDPCATGTGPGGLATLTGAMSMPVQGYHLGANLSAACTAALTDLAANTDILVVRRASTCAVGTAGCDALAAGDFYLQPSGCTTELTAGNYFAFDSNTGNLNLHQKDCVTAAPTYQFRTHIYFVANDDKAGDGIPTLMRAELGPNGFTVVPLVEGIENLQIEYGIDTGVPTTGAPALYTPDPTAAPLSCTLAACVSDWRNTVAVKVFVLARNLTTTQGYTDTKTYTLGVTAVAGNNGFKRHVYSTVAVLYNTAGRNLP